MTDTANPYRPPAEDAGPSTLPATDLVHRGALAGLLLGLFSAGLLSARWYASGAAGPPDLALRTSFLFILAGLLGAMLGQLAVALAIPGRHRHTVAFGAAFGTLIGLLLLFVMLYLARRAPGRIVPVALVALFVPALFGASLSLLSTEGRDALRATDARRWMSRFLSTRRPPTPPPPS
jgi:hypothetical protein